MEFKDKAEQLAALREDFDPAEIQVREENGIKLHYLEWSTVQNRLLDVLGAGGFDITVKDVFERKTRIDTLVELTVRWIDGSHNTVSGFGSSDILYLKADKELPFDERRWASDSYKSSFSDASKVAASKLGVGLYLYSKTDREELEAAVKSAHAEETQRKAEEKKQAQGAAMTTCMKCKNQIVPGEFEGKKYDDPVVLMKAIRAKTGKRICLNCAGEEAW